MNNIRFKISVTLMGLLYLSSVYARDLSVDIRCFSSPNNNINLEFRMYSDNDIGWVSGQVKYKQSESFIPLVYQGEELVREVADSPWELKHTWLEIVDGKINGQYHFISQGALMYDLTYTNRHTGRMVDISKQVTVDENGKCIW